MLRTSVAPVAEEFFFSSRRRHTRLQGDWSSDVCSSDLLHAFATPHDQSPPIHGTGRPRPAVGKLRAKSDVRRIRERYDVAGRKSIGKTGPRRVKLAEPKLEAGINSRKQDEQQNNNWRSLSQQFESGRQR